MKLINKPSDLEIKEYKIVEATLKLKYEFLTNYQIKPTDKYMRDAIAHYEKYAQKLKENKRQLETLMNNYSDAIDEANETLEQQVYIQEETEELINNYRSQEETIQEEINELSNTLEEKIEIIKCAVCDIVFQTVDQKILQLKEDFKDPEIQEVFTIYNLLINGPTAQFQYKEFYEKYIKKETKYEFNVPQTWIDKNQDQDHKLGNKIKPFILFQKMISFNKQDLKSDSINKLSEFLKKADGQQYQNKSICKWLINLLKQFAEWEKICSTVITQEAKLDRVVKELGLIEEGEGYVAQQKFIEYLREEIDSNTKIMEHLKEQINYFQNPLDAINEYLEFLDQRCEEITKVITIDLKNEKANSINNNEQY